MTREQWKNKQYTTSKLYFITINFSGNNIVTSEIESLPGPTISINKDVVKYTIYLNTKSGQKYSESFDVDVKMVSEIKKKWFRKDIEIQVPCEDPQEYFDNLEKLCSNGYNKNNNLNNCLRDYLRRGKVMKSNGVRYENNKR